MPQLTLHRGREVGCLPWGMERSLQANCFGGSSLLLPACCFSTTAGQNLSLTSKKQLAAEGILRKCCGLYMVFENYSTGSTNVDKLQRVKYRCDTLCGQHLMSQ